MNELQRAIRKMAAKKATKNDDIPIEGFKALARHGDGYLGWLLAFCNA
jgi:hypothetical protein